LVTNLDKVKIVVEIEQEQGHFRTGKTFAVFV